MIPASWFVALSGALFVLGIIGFFAKKDLISQFMAIEVMLNAGNLAFLALARGRGFAEAQVVAAEAAIGLAVILLVFRKKKSIGSGDARTMKG
jgi:NADH-quinone oxidoreductase subunit K